MNNASMYFDRASLLHLLENISNHFTNVNLLMDCYTEFAAKASKYKNPINDVGAGRVRKKIFQTVFAGNFAKKMYRLYEYKKGEC